MQKKMAPAEAYLRRKRADVPLGVRVSQEVKLQAQQAAEQAGTSLNRFTEAALIWYADAMKKKGRVG